MSDDENPSVILGTTTTVRTAKARLESRVKINPETGCHEWTGCVVGFGYGAMQYLGKKRTTHRLAWEFNFGPIPDGLWVLHKCDNPPCCNPKHLFLGTPKDNVHDSIAKKRRAKDRGTLNPKRVDPATMASILQEYFSCEGRVDAIAAKYGVSHKTILNNAGKFRRGQSGNLNPRAKLTDEIVKRIRDLHAEKNSLLKISEAVGLSWPTIKRVVRGESYL